MTDITVPAGTTVEGLESGIQTPTDWARAVLNQMGLPNTQSNIDFLVSWAAAEGGNWDNAAQFNPLNTTYRMPGSTVMSGGNSAGVQSYQSWYQGIQATISTLDNYSQIVDALRAGDAMSADQSGQMADDLSRWSGGGYTSIGQNTSYGGTTGGGGVGGVGGGTSAGQVPQVPGMNDMPALVAYIKQNDPSFSWLLDIPDVATVLEQAVANQDSNAQIQAAIAQTQWWQTTSQAVKNFQQNSAANPADYSFTTPGSIANQTLDQIKATAAGLGVGLTDQTAHDLAMNALKFGWTSQQIQQAIGASTVYTVGQAGGWTDADAVVKQLQGTAGQYLMSLSPDVLQSWAQNIVGGTQNMDQFKSYLANAASTKWTGMASQIQQGYTPNQIVDNYRTEAAKTMEVDPSSIDFVNNPTYSKILDYVPPNSTNGVHRLMTVSEMDQYLKGLPQWGSTQQARDQAANLEQTISQTFGKVGQ